ncbi:replication-associated protein [Circoviridae 12 LDMD-2013]|nr:replication-associated protein [Circoviridae 12 LDMD-2013]
MLTIPHASYTPYLPPDVTWTRGQLESGDGGYIHWQLLVGFAKKVSLRRVREVYGPIHAEISRSESAAAYVWKEDTRIDGTQFELGARPFRRNSATDWEAVWESAKRRDLESIPAQTRVVCYRSLLAIAASYDVPKPIVKSVYCFYGVSGSGKSRRAWDEAGVEAYSKDPRSKFWCGYQGQSNVVLDEFRGGIDVAHLLRWFDRYPVRVEIKGSSVPLAAERIWITSNLAPLQWYPELDPLTYEALMRRLDVTEFA